MNCANCGHPMSVARVSVNKGPLGGLEGALLLMCCGSPVLPTPEAIAVFESLGNRPQRTRSWQAESVDGSEQSESANAYQHGGSHYKDTGYDHWDFVLDTEQHYLQGNATKYITRARRHEAGAVLQLDKCLHYIHKAEEAAQQGRFSNVARIDGEELLSFAVANALTAKEAIAIYRVIAGDWALARQAVQQLRAELSPPAEQEDDQRQPE